MEYRFVCLFLGIFNIIIVQSAKVGSVDKKPPPKDECKCFEADIFEDPKCGWYIHDAFVCKPHCDFWLTCGCRYEPAPILKGKEVYVEVNILESRNNAEIPDFQNALTISLFSLYFILLM